MSYSNDIEELHSIPARIHKMEDFIAKLPPSGKRDDFKMIVSALRERMAKLQRRLANERTRNSTPSATPKKRAGRPKKKAVATGTKRHFYRLSELDKATMDMARPYVTRHTHHATKTRTVEITVGPCADAGADIRVEGGASYPLLNLNSLPPK